MLQRLLCNRTRTLRRLGTAAIFCLLLGIVVAFPQTPHSITIAWSYTQGTDPATGFFVYRGTTTGGPYTQLNATALPATAVSYVDTTGTAGTKYFYVVQAVDALGDLSGNSAEASASFLGNPSVPAGVTATAK